MEAEERDRADREPRQLKGLYKYVRISKRTLDKLIIILCAALVLCIGYGYQNRGYLVSFDGMGGTATESQKLMYGDYVAADDPTREGYTFTGWYRDENLTIPWNPETDTVSEPMTLYAGWQEN